VREVEEALRRRRADLAELSQRLHGERRELDALHAAAAAAAGPGAGRYGGAGAGGGREIRELVRAATYSGYRCVRAGGRAGARLRPRACVRVSLAGGGEH
jgi:hypothetical protein